MIIEGEYTIVDWDELIKDYGDKRLYVPEIQRKHNISKTYWNRHIVPELKNRCGLRSRGVRIGHKNIKYYSLINGKYNVVRTIKGKVHYYARVDTEEEAKKVVEFLKQNDWDKEKLKELMLKW